MNEKLIKDILGYVEGFGINIFAEVSIIFLLIGAVLLLCGAFVICLECYIRITGRRVNGTVVGAVKEVKIKEKIDDGKAEKEKKERLYAVFEYTHTDGSIRQEKSGSGGSYVLKYKTGQRVKLLVCQGEEKDSVYDMEDTTGRIIGFVLLLIGMACLYWGANIYASLGISMLTFIGIAVSFLIKNSKKNKKTTSKRVDGNSDNQFDPSKVRPIEEFVKEAKMK